MLFKTIMLSVNGLFVGSSVTLSILRFCGYAINPVIGVTLAAASFIPTILIGATSKKFFKMM